MAVSLLLDSLWAELCTLQIGRSCILICGRICLFFGSAGFKREKIIPKPQAHFRLHLYMAPELYLFSPSSPASPVPGDTRLSPHTSLSPRPPGRELAIPCCDGSGRKERNTHLHPEAFGINTGESLWRHTGQHHKSHCFPNPGKCGQDIQISPPVTQAHSYSTAWTHWSTH